MPNVSNRQTVTLLPDELRACFKDREDPGGITGERAACAADHPDESAIYAVLEYVRGKGEMARLAPVDFLKFGCFCHLDFYRLLALIIKGEWEWYVSQRVPAGKRIEDIVSEGLESVRMLSGGFNLAMGGDKGGPALYRLFEEHGRIVTNNGYDEKDFRDLIDHLILADIHLFSLHSAEMANFIAAEEMQRAILTGIAKDEAAGFWKKKRIWIELENDVEGLLLNLEKQTLKNRKTFRNWMAEFGHLYIPLVEAEYRFTSLNYRINCKEEDPCLTLKDLDRLENENRRIEEEHLARLKKNASVRKELPGSGGIPLDDREMEDYEKECKKLLRKIWRLTHPDNIEREKFTPAQKKKLRAYFEEAVPFQEGAGLEDEEIALSTRSLQALKDLLARVEAVWKSMGLDCNEHAVIQGETLAEQAAWLDARIMVLEEEAGQVRADIMAAVNDPETLEMEACLASPEQIDKISEEMSAKLSLYEEQIQLLEKRLAELFGAEII
ncbi:MAG TPA: hypothetical protein VMJ66_04540 [Geobacteraceae bacterium]|nr:hypothetical protein [Geobacteraceae bacterium]